VVGKDRAQLDDRAAQVFALLDEKKEASDWLEKAVNLG
jgi:hypothetical protein